MPWHLKKEWSGLIDQGVFDLGAVREYDAVAKEAKAKGEEIHMARAHGICVEKHSQLPVGDPKRKFKGRGVLLGSQVKNQSFEAAMFQDLRNSPASFEASRWADFLDCHDGWDVQMADAVQAYIQATLRGTPCWIELPPEAVPSECNWGKYRRPVVPLRKALTDILMREHFGSSAVMNRCAPLALNPSVRNGHQCTFMKSSSLFWLCMSMTSKWRATAEPCPGMEHAAYTFKD